MEDFFEDVRWSLVEWEEKRKADFQWWVGVWEKDWHLDWVKQLWDKVRMKGRLSGVRREKIWPDLERQLKVEQKEIWKSVIDTIGWELRNWKLVFLSALISRWCYEENMWLLLYVLKHHLWGRNWWRNENDIFKVRIWFWEIKSLS